MTNVLAGETTPAGKPSLFGAAELLVAVAGARRVLDVGCGSGRLTVALALAGAEVTGFDTSSERLDQARRRALEAGVGLSLVDADLNGPVPCKSGTMAHFLDASCGDQDAGGRQGGNAQMILQVFGILVGAVVFFLAVWIARKLLG